MFEQYNACATEPFCKLLSSLRWLAKGLFQLKWYLTN